MSSKLTLSIGNPKSGKAASYRGRVNGIPAEQGDSLELNDEISGGQFGGRVRGSWDHYNIRGEITEFSLDGQAQVVVNGKHVAAGDVAGLGYAGPTAPTGYDGPGSAAWTGTDAGNGGGTDADAGGGGGSGVNDGGGKGDSETSADVGTGSGGPSGDETGGGRITVESESPALGVVSRDYSTQHDIEWHVGGSDGDFGSLQAAVNALPHFIQHEVRIYLHGYSSESAVHVGPFVMAAHVDLVIQGVDGARLNQGANVNVHGKADHIEIKDITFGSICQSKGGRWVGCDFNGNGTAAFSGKDSAKMLIDCDVGADDDDYSIFSICGEEIEIRSCTLRGRKAAVKAMGTSTHAFTGNNDIKAGGGRRVIGGADHVHIGGERVN